MHRCWMQWLALPQFGLSTVFVVALVSARCCPWAPEPAVFGLIKLNPDLFWPAILVATVGNTLGGGGGLVDGLGAHKVVDRARGHPARCPGLAGKFGPGLPARWLLWWATRCAPWQAGSSCRSGLALATC